MLPLKLAVRAAARWSPNLVLLLLASLPACSPTARGVAARPPNEAKSAPAGGSGESAPSAVPSSAQADELISRHIAARGGIDKLRALKSVRLTGTTRFAQQEDFEIEATYGLVQKRPGSIRVEITFQGLTGVDACDGNEVWSTEPWDGRRDAFRQSTDESKDLMPAGDLNGPLVDWEDQGDIRVQYLRPRRRPMVGPAPQV